MVGNPERKKASRRQEVSERALSFHLLQKIWDEKEGVGKKNICSGRVISNRVKRTTGKKFEAPAEIKENKLQVHTPPVIEKGLNTGGNRGRPFFFI